ncbi:MAG: Stp1/IreP family PP2C-type Ser/Thr phosphatase [Tissierellia bacterium]|jgi:serine/threonine protein phosphatase PrpC|nr:Stp1/IreP family PP2C-type Ser/Thr phosphatase [Tissierellia bacterium]
MKFDAVSNVGKVRNNNEDSYYISEKENFPLFIVADGIGGHNFGEIASKMAVDVIKNTIKTIENYDNLDELESDMIKAISNANDEVYDMSNSADEYAGMGTTLTALYVYHDSMLIGHVGDSRTYAVNDREIRQLTEDDTIVNRLLKLGEITPSEAINHPKKNIITNAIGTDSNIDISLVQYNYGKGEYILMCTDGLTDMATNEEILNTINEQKTPSKISAKLLEIALEAGGKDNITLIILQV